MPRKLRRSCGRSGRASPPVRRPPSGLGSRCKERAYRTGGGRADPCAGGGGRPIVAGRAVEPSGARPQEAPELHPGPPPPPPFARFCQWQRRAARLRGGAIPPAKAAPPPDPNSGAPAASPLPLEAPKKTGPTASLRGRARDCGSEGSALPPPRQDRRPGGERPRQTVPGPHRASGRLGRERRPAGQLRGRDPGPPPCQSPATPGRRPPPSASTARARPARRTEAGAGVKQPPLRMPRCSCSE